MTEYSHTANPTPSILPLLLLRVWGVQTQTRQVRSKAFAEAKRIGDSSAMNRFAEDNGSTKGIIDSRGIELIARKVAARNGDARKALELARTTLLKGIGMNEAALIDSEGRKQNQSKQTGEAVSGPAASFRNALSVTKQAYKSPYEDILRNLTREARLMICFAARLRYGGSTKPEDDGKGGSFTLSTMYAYGAKELNRRGSALAKTWNQQSFGKAIDMLRAGGLVATDTGGRPTLHPNARVIVNVNANDIRAAFSDDANKDLYLSLL